MNCRKILALINSRLEYQFGSLKEEGFEILTGVRDTHIKEIDHMIVLGPNSVTYKVTCEEVSIADLSEKEQLDYYKLMTAKYISLQENGIINKFGDVI